MFGKTVALIAYVLFVVCLQSPVLAALTESSAPEALKIQVDESTLAIQFKGKPLLVYAFATNQFKPYVRELYTLRGDNVLRDAPADHLHHHGLMYAMRVNDVNFWEERDQPGYEIPVKLVSPQSRKTREGLPEASFTQLIHWVAHTNATAAHSESVALLVERRTLTLTVNEPRAEIALHWQAEFTIGPGAPKVKLHGSAYNGLGLRLPSHWDRVATHINSENAPYSAEQNWDVTPARWAAVSGASPRALLPQPASREPDGEVTFVLFGRPSNSGETRFFSMLNPFAYLSVTQNLEKAPLEYVRGEEFGLDYLVLLYPEKKSAGFLEQRYQSWIKRIASK